MPEKSPRKSKLADAELLRDAARSDQEIAAAAGCHPAMVGIRRKRLETDGRIAKREVEARMPRAPKAGARLGPTVKGHDQKYEPRFARMARKLYARGGSDEDVADLLEVSSRSIRTWKLTRADFAEAARLGKEVADDILERKLYERAHGYTVTQQKPVIVGPDRHVEIVEVKTHIPGDPGLLQYWMSQRRPAEWGNNKKATEADAPMPAPGGLAARRAALAALELAFNPPGQLSGPTSPLPVEITPGERGAIDLEAARTDVGGMSEAPEENAVPSGLPSAPEADAGEVVKLRRRRWQHGDPIDPQDPTCAAWMKRTRTYSDGRRRPKGW
jgi:hypothetical protein